jgi:hypothetical protein
MAEGQPKKWSCSISQSTSISLFRPAWVRTVATSMRNCSIIVHRPSRTDGSTLYVGAHNCLNSAAYVPAPRARVRCMHPALEPKLIHEVNRLRASACREFG